MISSGLSNADINIIDDIKEDEYYAIGRKKGYEADSEDYQILLSLPAPRYMTLQLF